MRIIIASLLTCLASPVVFAGTSVSGCPNAGDACSVEGETCPASPQANSGGFSNFLECSQGKWTGVEVPPPGPALGPNDWSCQGICGYFDEHSYSYLPIKPFKEVQAVNYTAADAFADAEKNCTITPPEGQGAALLRTVTSQSSGGGVVITYLPASIEDVCIKN